MKKETKDSFLNVKSEYFSPFSEEFSVLNTNETQLVHFEKSKDRQDHHSDFDNGSEIRNNRKRLKYYSS